MTSHNLSSPLRSPTQQTGEYYKQEDVTPPASMFTILI